MLGDRVGGLAGEDLGGMGDRLGGAARGDQELGQVQAQREVVGAGLHRGGEAVDQGVAHDTRLCPCRATRRRGTAAPL
ncbi:hypothetical protein ACTI_75140 [Actinoplanes sp. OR16]|nr:hypothetical protein ACTI_75140 [Actinoplanes sp. OR16]